MIKSIPKQDNPREKVKTYGIESLSNSELLALIIHTGNKNESVLELSNRILNEIGGFSQLQYLNLSLLTSINGIGEAKAITLLSVLELSKRITSMPYNRTKIDDPHQIYHYVKDEMMLLNQEHFMMVCLDNRNKIISKKTIFKGSLKMSIVEPREVFKEALTVNAASIIMIHNHPSGDPQPSEADIEITLKFIEIGILMGIQVIDHIIIGWNCYYSIMSNLSFDG